MSDFFSFVVTSGSDRSSRTLIVFTAASHPSDIEIIEHLRTHCERNPPPDQVRLWGHAGAETELRAAVNSDHFLNRLPAVTRFRDEPQVFVSTFDASGNLAPAPPELDYVRQGAALIFRRRAAMLEASTAHHYVKPSGKHTDRFLRSANALVGGAELDFLAFCVLPFLPQPLTRVYTDTGAINSVAFVALGLRSRITGTPMESLVDSFGSYEGLKTYDMRVDDNTVILLSASTSGDLERRIRELEPSFPQERIVHLFYLAPQPAEGRVVCDLSWEPIANPHGYPPIVSHPAPRCPLCAEGSVPIRIHGDQFLPEGQHLEQHIMVADDAPLWLRPFLSRYAGKDFLRAYYRAIDQRNALREVYLDTQSLFEKNMARFEEAKSEVDRIITQSVSAEVKRIVHLDDPGSRALAEYIRRTVNNAEPPDLVSLGEIEASMDSHILESGASVVVAGAAASGRSHIAASRVMRHVQSNRAVTYITGFARLPTTELMRELRNNLTFGDHPGDYAYFVVEQLEVPLLGSEARCSWDEESAAILRIGETEPLSRELEARMATLDAASAKGKRGLIDDLFWTPLDGQPLRLSPGFVFLDKNAPPRVSQADVFFALTAVLHRLRMREGPRGSLRQDGHVRRLLSPRNFERFNDAVIQAALLRAALPIEMDYSLDATTSAEMREVVRFVFRNVSSAAGGAARELAVALGTHRLRLDAKDMVELDAEGCAPESDPIAMSFWKLALRSG